MESIIWKDIEGYEGMYQVSDIGVRSLKKGKVIVMKIAYSGRYPHIGLYKKGLKVHSVHRLVGKAFIENPLNLPELDHINNNKNDFRSCNLQWITRKDNMKKALRGTVQKYWEGKTRENHPRSIAVGKYSKDNILIKVYQNSIEASENENIVSSSICKCCNGKRKTAGGFKWKYIRKVYK